MDSGQIFVIPIQRLPQNSARNTCELTIHVSHYFSTVILIIFVIFIIIVSFSQSCCSGISRRNTGNLTLYSISCTGNSDFFTQDCSYGLIPGYSGGGCNLQHELIIGCYLQSTCTQNNIRLVGGNSSLEGRVEMCYQNLWGAIVYQSYAWDANDAMVVCRQLGLPWECKY